MSFPFLEIHLRGLNQQVKECESLLHPDIINSSLVSRAGVLRLPLSNHLLSEVVQRREDLPPSQPGRSEGEQPVVPEPGRPETKC